MWWISRIDQTLYQGAARLGDVEATDAEVLTWLAGQATLAVVTAECARRVALVVSDDQKFDLLAAMIAEHIQGNTGDDANFLASMQWIGQMRAAIPGLVGNVAYSADASWPQLPAGLASWVGKF